MTNGLKYLGLILIGFFISFLLRDYFFDLSFSQIANEDIQIVTRNISSPFYFQILFAIAIGSIPLLYLIIKKLTNLTFIPQGLISCGIILVSGILLWKLRIFQLNNEFKMLSKFQVGNGIEIQMDSSKLYLATFLFIGFIIGTILSILIYRNKK